MRGEQPLGEAGVALLSDRLKKASKLVERAAKGVGDVRDHDVLADRVKRIAKEQRLGKKGIRDLRAEIDTRGRRATKELREVMRREDPARLFAKVGRRIAQVAGRSGPRGDDHRILVRHFAASVLVRRYETVLAYEVVVPAPIEVLHRLRVAIKKLRYAIDFFGAALGSERAQDLDRPLQSAQDQLGELHDHHVGRALVAVVERKHTSKHALAKLRDAEDGEAEQLLAVFGRSWQVITQGRFADALAGSVRDLLGRGMRASTLALRRAEQAR